MMRHAWTGIASLAALLAGGCSSVNPWRRSEPAQHHTVALWPVLNATGHALNARRFGRIPARAITPDATVESLLSLPRQTLPELTGALLATLLRARGFSVVDPEAAAQDGIEEVGDDSLRRFDAPRRLLAGDADFASKLAKLATRRRVTAALLCAVTHFDEGIDDLGADWAEFGAHFVLVEAPGGGKLAEGVWRLWRGVEAPVEDVELLDERFFLNETEALIERFLREALVELGM